MLTSMQILSDFLWSCIKSKSQEASGVSELVNRDGIIQSNTDDKKQIMNEQFRSVYTQEDNCTIQDKVSIPHTFKIDA